MPAIFFLGFFTGLRCMTPIAILCWFAWSGSLELAGWRSFAANLIAAGVFTLFALGELVGDKLPNTPNRTEPLGLIARIVLSSFIGLLLAPALGVSPFVAVAIGAVGSVAGTYGGWFARTRAVASLHSKDWPVAILEDLITILGSVLTLHFATTNGFH